MIESPREFSLRALKQFYCDGSCEKLIAERDAAIGAEAKVLIPGAYLAAAEYVESCGEGGSLSDAVQIYDVMANHIEKLTPADAQLEIDIRVAEAKVEEAEWWLDDCPVLGYTARKHYYSAIAHRDALIAKRGAK